MRPSLLAAPLLFAAAPAAATGGFDCRATDGSGIVMSGTIGRVAGTPLISASLRIGDHVMASYGGDPEIAIARSWIDEDEIRVDLAHPELERIEARLRARIARSRGRGTLERRGVVHPVLRTVD